MVARRRLRRAAGPVISGFVLLALGLLASCGAAEDELTTEQQLEKLVGRPLTSTEVDEQLVLADTMCAFDDDVLSEIWYQLDARQLEFQDWVFGQHCPDRLPDYEAARPETGVVDPDILETTETTVDPAVMADAAELLDSIGTTVPQTEGGTSEDDSTTTTG